MNASFRPERRVFEYRRRSDGSNARSGTTSVARFRLSRSDGTGIVRDGAGAGLGDVWTGLKVKLAGDSPGAEVALRGAVKFPTGRLP